MSAIERLRSWHRVGIIKDREFWGQLLAEIEALDERGALLCEEWSEDHTYLQDLCRKAGVPEDNVTGVSTEVLPGIQDLADMLYQKLKQGPSGDPSDAVNALHHIGNDHPCCKEAIEWIIRYVEGVEKDRERLKQDLAETDELISQMDAES